MPKSETAVAEPKAKARAKAPARPRRAARVKKVKQTAEAYFDAMAARDAEAAASHWHAEGVHETVPVGVFRGPGAVADLFRQTFAAMPDMEIKVERITADDEAAAVQWRARGTFTGAPFQGIEPTGRRIELRGTDYLEVDEDGSITRNTAIYDGAAFARGVGMLPAEDSGAERAMRSAFNTVTKLRKAARGTR
jgi:steroid delta-isomerase-like uncharacterized protein